MDAMPAWHSEPIPPESREALFRQTKSFHALQETMKRRWWAAGWIVGGLGMTIATISTITLMVTLQRWHPTPFFIAVDTSTGWVGEAVGAMDAPKLFSNRIAAQYLRTYVEAREGYLPDRDRAQWETVRAMSSGDEFERYEAWRKSDLAPVKQLGTTGKVDTFNFVPSSPSRGNNGTLSYIVRFQRREVKGQSIGPAKQWRAVIDFQWHPEMTMSTPDSQINPAGMQVISYKSEQDE
jgi:type IV secretory pathway component VirB8